MRNRFLEFVVAVLSVLILQMPIIAAAQSPAISSGLNWLNAAQSSDGSWDSTTTTTDSIQATSAAMVSLAVLNSTTSQNYVNAANWLTAQQLDTTRSLAERLSIFPSATPDRDSILSYRDELTLAWGGYDDFAVNTLDTALALQALKAANYPDLSVINTALAYLTNSQNADGGWGFYKDNPSNVYMTAVVSATFRQFPQTASVANAITKAMAYIVPMQNVGGGFGYPSSSVYETALAYSALIGTTTDAVVLGNSLNYVISSQSSNGSWNDDPYSTALALKALYLSEHIPGPPPAAATTGSVMGTIIDATTKAPIANVSVQLAGDPSHAAVSDGNGMFALYGIPVGSQQITLSHQGHASITITASISASTFINLGKVSMSVNPISGTVMGIVWNADRNEPFGGVTVESTSGIQTLRTLSAADGSYKITGVSPGTVIVGTPAGPAGEGTYWNVTMTGTLAAGGVMIYNPTMSKNHPPFVNAYAETDKAIYLKGDTVNMTFQVQNNRSVGSGTLLNVKVTDPFGTVVHTASVAMSLSAKQMSVQSLSFTLPANAQGGFYTVLGEVSDANEKIGEASANFGIFMSKIAVTPALPATIAVGTNTVAFNLVNEGNYEVASGVLDVKRQKQWGSGLRC